MPLIYGIDPGTTESAIVRWDGKCIRTPEIILNTFLLRSIRAAPAMNGVRRFAIEMIASMGMPVGREVFETVLFIGALREAITSRGGTVELIYRRDVKLHLCGQARAKDANVIQALKDRFGEKGTKDKPGVTYGLKSHLWQAFAVAVTAFDKLK